MGHKKKISLLVQIALLFVVGVILIGAISAFALYGFSTRYVRDRLETIDNSTAEDLKGYVLHFPAHEWLLRYWYEHYDELEIEYDSIYTGGMETEEKYALISDRHPEFHLEYATAADVEALPPEDQKLYAEIVYSWLIDRVDYILTAYDLDYLFCVVTDEPYDRQFVLFIAAGEEDVRGSEPGQIYPIGRSIQVTAEIQEAMRKAAAGQPSAAHSRDRKFFDYFYPMTNFDGHETLLVMTIDVLSVREAIVTLMSDFGLLFTALIIALAAVCMIMIYFVVLRPLRKIQKNISLYKETKDSRVVTDNLAKIQSRNEIAELSGDVAEMAKELTAYMIRSEQNAIREEHNKTELNLASKIQTSMLPNVFPAFPERKDFEIYASMTLAREVGGDFYEFFLVDNSHLCLMIADVSGKGIPAALFMMATKILLEHNAKMGKSPAEVLVDVNKAICSKNAEDMFVTVWLGILDLETGKLTCVNAGHEYPILKKPGEPYKLIKDTHGIVVGAMPDALFHEYVIRMEPGASLFLYTDGLTEAVNPGKQMFGTERILQNLNEGPDKSPKETLAGMKKAVNAFVQGLEPYDDLTMMELTYRGPAAD